MSQTDCRECMARNEDTWDFACDCLTRQFNLSCLGTVWLVLSTQVVTVMEFEGYMLELGH